MTAQASPQVDAPPIAPILCLECDDQFPIGPTLRTVDQIKPTSEGPWPSRIPRRSRASRRSKIRSGSSRWTTCCSEQGPDRVRQLLRVLQTRAQERGVKLPFTANTPYINTIPAAAAAALPGQPRDRAPHQEPSSAGTRWRWWCAPTASRTGIGGHISTYASAATLYEVGFNHFFRGRNDELRRRPGLLPGPRLARHLRPRLPRGPAVARSSWRNFRRELRPGGGLSSYPHPWLMPDFWEFPTVSMGLGPIMAIYQARFNRYLEDRGLQARRATARSGRFLGDGETRRARVARRHHAGRAREARQPHLRHQLQPAAPRRPGARQRQDHPGARGGLPRRRLERHQGDLGRRLGPAARRTTTTGLLRQAHGRGASTASTRSTRVETAPTSASTSSATYPELLEHGRAPTRTSSSRKLRRGGHDPEKVYAAYKAAVEHQGHADGHPGQDHQGLRPGRGRRGQEHHAPAEEAERGRAAGVPHPLRHPDLRRGRRRGAVLPAGRRQRRDAATCASAARRWAASLPRARQQSQPLALPDRRRCSSEFHERHRGDREAVDHDGLRAHAGEAAARPGDRQADRADRARRGAHLRHGGAVPPGRHLLARRPALRAGRSRARCSTTRKPRTGRSSKKASPRPARWPRSSPPAPPTPPTAST